MIRLFEPAERASGVCGSQLQLGATGGCFRMLELALVRWYRLPIGEGWIDQLTKRAES